MGSVRFSPLCDQYRPLPDPPAGPARPHRLGAAPLPLACTFRRIRRIPHAGARSGADATGSAPGWIHRQATILSSGDPVGRDAAQMDAIERADVRAAILQWMAAHHGLITFAKALELGLNRNQISGLVRHGRWEVVVRGVYRLAGCPAVPEQQHLAAVWRCGDDAYLTAAPALGVWGIEGFSCDVDPVVLVPSGRTVRGVDFEVRRRATLSAGDRTERCQIPIATRTRSLVDLAHDTRGREFRVGFDAVKRVGGTDSARLRRRAEAALPQRGAQYVIELVDSGLLDMESEGERDFFAIVEGIRPQLAVQQELLPGIRVDFVWLDARLVVEYDGVARHTLATDRAHDRRRRSRLRAEGWDIAIVRKEDLADPHRLVRRLLSRRRTRLAAAAVAAASEQ